MRTKTEEEKVLSEELSSCMLGHYKYCAAGMLLGLPLSIHRKSYWPVTLAAVAGTAADFMDGNKNCRPQREALLACIARNEAPGPKAQQAVGETQPRDTPPPQGWAQEQPEWPEQKMGWEESGGGADGDKGGKDKW